MLSTANQDCSENAKREREKKNELLNVKSQNLKILSKRKEKISIRLNKSTFSVCALVEIVFKNSNEITKRLFSHIIITQFSIIQSVL